MANVSAVIDLRVTGLKGIDAVTNKLKQIEKITKSIKPIPSIFDRRQSESVKNAQDALTGLLKKFGEKGKASDFANTISGLNNQLSSFNRIANNSKVNSEQFANSLLAGENASRQLLRAELKRIQTLNNAYSTDTQAKGGASVGIGKQLAELLKVGNTMPKSTAGLNTYRAELERVLNVVDIGSKEYRELEEAIKRVNAQMRQLKARGVMRGTVSGDTGFSASQYGPQRARGRSGRSGRFGRIIQSAGIGGGFPLLFGGGPLQSIAGLLGGGIGEAISPRGGFAGSIAATAIVSQVSQAVTAVGALGKALNPLTADIGKLTRAIGIVGTAEAERLKVIEELAGKQAALKAASDLLANQIGTAGVQALKTFGEDFQTLGNEFSRLFTAMGASLANFINNSGALKALIESLENRNLRTQAFNNQDPEMQGLIKNLQRAEFEQDIAGVSGGGISLKEQEKLQNNVAKARQKVFDLQRKTNAETDIQINLTRTAKDIFDANLKKLEKEGSILKEKLKNGDAAAEIKKLELDLQERLNDEKFEFTDKQKEALIDAKNLNDETNKTIELFKQIKTTIATGITNAIKGLIEGTKTLGESLGAIAKQIADLILQKAILSAVDKVFTFGSGGVTKGSVSDLPKVATAAQGAFFGNGIRPFSTGGITTRPTLGLIGEAGESEYIIPASKMSTAMQRYSAGARGESVIPGIGSSQSVGGGGGSTTVNYSGPILNFNSEEFVPKSAVNDIISTAARQGASQGSSQTFATLRNSRSARSRIGL
tara:strand:+ start:873 stop:3182 length:2310 start_codon:yes stop_codon:yes gene_type:complete